MALFPTLSNIIIEGNTISKGISTNGSTPTTYNYDVNVLSSADCIITENMFSGINANIVDGYMIHLTDGSSKITQNTFVRNASSINSYINYGGAYDCIITDNFFDSSTVDGSSELLAAGLTGGTVFERNKNQTKYFFLSLLDGQTSNDNIQYFFPNNNNIQVLTSNNGTYPTPGFGNSLGAVNSFYTMLQIQDTTQHQYLRVINLDGKLPQNVTILEFKTGIFYFLGTASLDLTSDGEGPTNEIIMTITTSLTDIDSEIDTYAQVSGTVSPGTGTITSPSKTITSSGDVADISTPPNTFYLTAATTLVTAKNYSINMSFLVRIKSSTLTPFIQANFSPIRIKYRW